MACDDFYQAALLHIEKNDRNSAVRCVDFIKTIDPYSPLIKKLMDKIYAEPEPKEIIKDIKLAKSRAGIEAELSEDKSATKTIFLGNDLQPIPTTKTSNSDAVGVVIGVRDYKNPDVPKALFGKLDLIENNKLTLPKITP